MRCLIDGCTGSGDDLQRSIFTSPSRCYTQVICAACGTGFTVDESAVQPVQLDDSADDDEV